MSTFERKADLWTRVKELERLVKALVTGRVATGTPPTSHVHSHDTELTAVSADDHHTEVHTMSEHSDGPYGTGSVAHNDLTGVTANQHHNQDHTDSQHTDGPNSKPGHSHSHDTDLTGVSADDHHAQDHAARHAADAADPLIAFTKSGAGATISDADFSSAPPNGTIASAWDSTALRGYLYVRLNGSWLSVEVA